MKKSSTNERVKLAKLEPAALLHTSDQTVIALCAAQYFSSNPQPVHSAATVHERGEQKEFVLPAA